MTMFGFNVVNTPVENDSTIPTKKPQITVGMKFGNLSDNDFEASNVVYNKHGIDVSIFHERCLNYDTSISLKSSQKIVIDAHQHGHAAYLKYSDYDNQYEYIQYSNGYNNYKSAENNRFAAFDTIEIQYRDENGEYRNQYAVDRNNNGVVDNGEIYDGILKL